MKDKRNRSSFHMASPTVALGLKLCGCDRSGSFDFQPVIKEVFSFFSMQGTSIANSFVVFPQLQTGLLVLPMC
jgi:hypothetical protein